MSMIDIGDGVSVAIGSQEHADAIKRAVDGRNDMVHASFNYQCRSCRSVELIYLGVGVEGPAKLRESGLYIASPFMGPVCLLCRGDTMHIAWSSDQHFEPIDAQPGWRYFRVPHGGVDMRCFLSSAFAGELAGSSGTTTPNPARPSGTTRRFPGNGGRFG